MSNVRKMGFHHPVGFLDAEGSAQDPTDAERVELAIAALTHGTERELPDVGEVHALSDDYRADVFRALAKYRLALARDAAAKEAEQESRQEIAALAEALFDSTFMSVNDLSIAARAYELGARSNAKRATS